MAITAIWLLVKRGLGEKKESMMNEKYFESAEFYQKRFHNFASLWVVPCFLLLLFVVGFSIFAKKEVTLSSRGTIEATRVVDQIQSTSNSPIQVNHLKENKEKKELLKWMIKRILLLIPVVCILFWIFGRCQTSVIKDQTKIGVTYMTMNNEFYKSIHSEISRIADEKEALVYVRDPELDEKKAEPADR